MYRYCRGGSSSQPTGRHIARVWFDYLASIKVGWKYNRTSDLRRIYLPSRPRFSTLLIVKKKKSCTAATKTRLLRPACIESRQKATISAEFLLSCPSYSQVSPKSTPAYPRGPSSRRGVGRRAGEAWAFEPARRGPSSRRGVCLRACEACAFEPARRVPSSRRGVWPPTTSLHAFENIPRHVCPSSIRFLRNLCTCLPNHSRVSSHKTT
jgi:hypothetical protein